MCWRSISSKYTTDYGSLDTRRSDKGGNNSAAELAFNDSMMQLARYPDYVKASDVPAYPKTIDVSGSGLNPDVSGTYSQAGTYNGKPYYKLSGQNWFIYFRPQNAVYYLADLKALGGAGTYAWWSGGGSYPTGSYHPDSGSPSGMPYAESTDNIGFVAYRLDAGQHALRVFGHAPESLGRRQGHLHVGLLEVPLGRAQRRGDEYRHGDQDHHRHQQSVRHQRARAVLRLQPAGRDHRPGRVLHRPFHWHAVLLAAGRQHERRADAQHAAG